MVAEGLSKIQTQDAQVVSLLSCSLCDCLRLCGNAGDCLETNETQLHTTESRK